LNGTLAPFTGGLKPQLSPWPAVVFSKRAAAIYNPGSDARVPSRRTTSQRACGNLGFGLILKAFPSFTGGDRDAMTQPKRRSVASASGASFLPNAAATLLHGIRIV
jgi:hypothetical protein